VIGISCSIVLSYLIILSLYRGYLVSAFFVLIFLMELLVMTVTPVGVLEDFIRGLFFPGLQV
jgi:hypothetical protein